MSSQPAENRLAVGVLDYGSGNIRSVCHALERVGAAVTLSSSSAELRRLDRLVVPGVGAFAACMTGLHRVSGAELIAEFIAQDKAVLGICVGHQILFASGHELGQRTAGLGHYPGSVDKLSADRLPHMGWNQVQAAAGSKLFNGVADQRFYFVHSYAAHLDAQMPPGALVSLATHQTDQFIAAVEYGSLSSTQFHPEKSGRAGAALLRNWLIG